MITLNASDKDIINHLGYPKKVQLSSGEYFIKLASLERGINELLGKRLAKIMNIQCAHYELVKVDGCYYTLSEDLNELGEFKTAIALGITKLPECSFNEVWNFLENEYGLSSKEMFELIKVYIFDIIFKNFDRNTENWGIIFANNTRAIAILDNEYILDNDKETNCLSFHVLTKDEPDPLIDLERFIVESSSEFIDLFKYYLDLFTPTYFESILLEALNTLKLTPEEKDTIVKEYQEIYLNNYQEIKNVINRNRGTYGR